MKEEECSARSGPLRRRRRRRRRAQVSRDYIACQAVDPVERAPLPAAVAAQRREFTGPRESFSSSSSLSLFLLPFFSPVAIPTILASCLFFFPLSFFLPAKKFRRLGISPRSFSFSRAANILFSQLIELHRLHCRRLSFFHPPFCKLFIYF